MYYINTVNFINIQTTSYIIVMFIYSFILAESTDTYVSAAALHGAVSLRPGRLLPCLHCASPSAQMSALPGALCWDEVLPASGGLLQTLLLRPSRPEEV